MKTTAIGLSLAALVLGGSAFAAPGTPAANSSTPDLRRDADRNGVHTRAEAQAAAAAMFTRLDVNTDGKLDRADRQARRAAAKTRMFERLDANKDGQLTRAEFLANDARSALREGRRAARRGGRDHAGPGGMAGTKRLGAAGELTQAQFVAAALQRFDARDANKDGQITAEERQQSREQRKARHRQSGAAKAQG